MGKKKPEMSKEQLDTLLQEANAARKPEKLSAPLIIILVISILAILIYLYSAIAGIGTKSILSYFPLIMYLLMYISIIKYIFDYFVKAKDATIDGMLMRYCALTGASTILAGEGLSQTILIINVFILIFVPLVRENLAKTNFKQCSMLSILIAILCIVSAVCHLSALSYGDMSGLNLVVAIFDAINPTVQWILFLALYFIRFKKGTVLVKQVIAQHGAEAAVGAAVDAEAAADTAISAE